MRLGYLRRVRQGNKGADLALSLKKEKKIWQMGLRKGNEKDKRQKNFSKASWELLQTSQCNVKNQTDVLDLRASKVFKNRYQIEKLIIVSIRKPATDGYRMLGMEDVRRWRIVDDDGLSNVSAYLGKILYTCQLQRILISPREN